MMPPIIPTTAAPNGQRAKIPTTPGAGTTRVTDPTRSVGLITSRNLQWGPWAVTFEPITFNNSAALYVDPVPLQPATVIASEYVGYPQTGNPLVTMSWGVAGVLRTVCFDYPIMGGVAVINANAVEVSVRPRYASPSPYVDEAHVPNVGAWITPSAAPAGPISRNLFAGYALVGGTHSVPPFAKNFVASAYMPVPLAILPLSELQVTFYNEQIVPIMEYRQAVGGNGAAGPEFFPFPVPPQAVAVSVAHSAGTCEVCGMWELTFA